VLELVVTEFLFEKYAIAPEGELTSLRAALVNYQMMARVAREIGLEKYILLSRGEAKDIGKAREVILANAIEALFGAIYCDQGYHVAQEVIARIVLPHLEEIVAKGLHRDPKSVLQEIVQENMRVTPTYRVLHERGPDHKKKFSVGVFFGDTCGAEGIGTSKQEAEVKAAENALRTFSYKKK